ncbi:MAG: HlyD family secretion protein [Vicinamibacterales bacterium]
MAGASTALASPRLRAALGVLVLIAAGIAAWLFLSGGRESTDDAQLEGLVTPIASRIGGTVRAVHVLDHQTVKAGDILVEIEPRDYQLALERAKAELADAEASAAVAQHELPVATAAATSGVAAAEGSLEQARGGIAATEREVDAARARLSAAQAREREAQANAQRLARDVERLKGLLAKEEVAQQQFDAVQAGAEAQRAAVDSARAQMAEAEAAIRAAESRLAQVRATETQAAAALRAARTAPDRIGAARARAAAAQARVDHARAALGQAELNLQYATVRAPGAGVVARKSVNPGQVIQPGQPLLAIVGVEDVWVVANFKETQLADIRPGQRATVAVDAYGGRTFTGTVEAIGGATGARFSLLPPENATGNFVKVVQRVPVKIVLDPGQHPDVVLRPGMSVVPVVQTR